MLPILKPQIKCIFFPSSLMVFGELFIGQLAKIKHIKEIGHSVKLYFIPIKTQASS